MFDTTLSGSYPGAADALHGEVELTFPQNRIWGIKRGIEVFREFQPKKDSIEYTVYLRAGTNLEDLDAFVVVTNVKVTEGFMDPAA